MGGLAADSSLNLGGSHQILAQIDWRNTLTISHTIWLVDQIQIT